MSEVLKKTIDRIKNLPATYWIGALSAALTFSQMTTIESQNSSSQDRNNLPDNRIMYIDSRKVSDERYATFLLNAAGQPVDDQDAPIDGVLKPVVSPVTLASGVTLGEGDAVVTHPDAFDVGRTVEIDGVKYTFLSNGQVIALKK